MLLELPEEDANTNEAQRNIDHQSRSSKVSQRKEPLKKMAFEGELKYMTMHAKGKRV